MDNLGAPEPTILYVDDQPSHRVLFQKAFRADWLVLTASSAAEGIEILKTHDIFLVIADHNMPGENGVDFLQEVRQVSPQVVRAILSAYSDPELIREAMARAQIAQYLRKPWKRDEIRQFIESAFRKYHFSGAPTELGERGEPTELGEPAPKRISIPTLRLCELFEGLEPLPAAREVRRILLNHVEPRLKETVALIVRPCSESLREAQQACLKGNLRGMEKALARYLKETPAASSETSVTSSGPSQPKH